MVISDLASEKAKPCSNSISNPSRKSSVEIEDSHPSDMPLNRIGLLDLHLRFCQRRPISDSNRRAYTPVLPLWLRIQEYSFLHHWWMISDLDFG